MHLRRRQEFTRDASGICKFVKLLQHGPFVVPMSHMDRPACIHPQAGFCCKSHPAAAAEDRGFVLGLISGAPNATLDQTQKYTGPLYPLMKESMPEVDVAFTILGFEPSWGLWQLAHSILPSRTG